jgi:hypothetical protein
MPASEKTPPVCNALWIGPTLGPVEAACLSSFVDAGHRVDLHVYDEPAGVPPCVRLVDAALTLPRNHLVRHRKTGSYSLVSNRFRYALMAAGRGLWIDSDVVCLRAIEDRPYIFGREDETTINGAVLKLPANAAVLEDLLGVFETRRWVPPWIRSRKRLQYRLLYRLGGRFGLADMPWGTAGPRALTHYLARHGLSGHATPPHILYPVGPNETDLLLRPDAAVLRPRIKPDTLCIHLWSKLRAETGPASRGSLVSRLADGSWRQALGLADPVRPMAW